MNFVDLNSDLGEGFGPYKMGNDEDILKIVSSVNLACGWHGGDPLIMEKTVSLAKKYGARVGAHPGFPDLLGFGRRRMDISLGEARAYVLYQLGALHAFARTQDLGLQHLKLHGAFYNMAAKDRDMAKVIIEAVRKFDENIYFLCLSGSEFAKVAKEEGALVAQEVFADRGYNDDGSLVNRSLPGAVIKDEEEAIKRTLRMVKEKKVVSVKGTEIPIEADSICVHGDNPKALLFVEKIRKALEENDIEVRPFGKI